MKQKKMVMTQKLANELMNTLACVDISAAGGAIQDEEGNFNQEQLDYAERYAKETFCALLDSWEEMTGAKWSIE